MGLQIKRLQHHKFFSPKSKIRANRGVRASIFLSYNINTRPGAFRNRPQESGVYPKNSRAAAPVPLRILRMSLSCVQRLKKKKKKRKNAFLHVKSSPDLFLNAARATKKLFPQPHTTHTHANTQPVQLRVPLLEQPRTRAR